MLTDFFACHAGMKHNDCTHPDYVPSQFAYSKTDKSKVLQKLDRFTRLRNRKSTQVVTIVDGGSYTSDTALLNEQPPDTLINETNEQPQDTLDINKDARPATSTVQQHEPAVNTVVHRGILPNDENVGLNESNIVLGDDCFRDCSSCEELNRELEKRRKGTTLSLKLGFGVFRNTMKSQLLP